MDDTMLSTASSKKGGGNIKGRVALLEEKDTLFQEELGLHDKRLLDLERGREQLVGKFATTTENINSRISREMLALKDDAEHKFGLQNAENKRLQHHVQSLRAENAAMKDLIDSLTSRLTALEAEVNGDD
jgi:hypothetical protein